MNKPTLPVLSGTTSIAELAETTPAVTVRYGKDYITDPLKKLAQIRGLKPGSSTIRTDAMVEEILHRLAAGETLVSISMEDHICDHTTFRSWVRKDEELKARYYAAMEDGASALSDLRMDIALGGEFSTTERRDEIAIKTIKDIISARNRREFGNHQSIDMRSIAINVSPEEGDWN